MQHGWNTTCYQLLNPGMKHWFPDSGDALIGYVTHAGTRVVAGAPVCARERFVPVATEFEASARRQGERVCFFAAEEWFERRWQHHRTRARIVLGAQPVWNLQSWPEHADHSRNLRAQLNRARNKQVRVTEWPTGRAQGCNELRAVHAGWLAGRGLPPLRFLVESDVIDHLGGRRIFVAESAAGTEGFLTACPVPARNGWLAELVVRRGRAPHGTAALLVDQAARLLAADGAARFTLGLSPLAHPHSQTPLPVWLRLMQAWLRAHGRRFYNFRGLEYFKAKFDPPEWQPIYAMLPGRRTSPRDLYAIAAAFAGGPPFSMLARAMSGAVRDELGSLVQRWSPPNGARRDRSRRAP